MSLYELLISAAEGRRDEGFSFLLSEGDSCQMSAQKEFLQSRGFDVGQRDIYPALRTLEEFKKALTLFWECGVDGWWCYEHQLIKYGICTQEEFDAKMGRE